MVIDFYTRQVSGTLFELRLPVIFRWSDGSDQVDGGFTTYVSQHAVWVLSDRLPPLESQVSIEVLLPLSYPTVNLLRLKAVGKVLPLASESEFSGFLFQGTFEEDQIFAYQLDSQSEST